jgi:hypothetical protein
VRGPFYRGFTDGQRLAYLTSRSSKVRPGGTMTVSGGNS